MNLNLILCICFHFYVNRMIDFEVKKISKQKESANQNNKRKTTAVVIYCIEVVRKFINLNEKMPIKWLVAWINFKTKIRKSIFRQKNVRRSVSFEFSSNRHYVFVIRHELIVVLQSSWRSISRWIRWIFVIRNFFLSNYNAAHRRLQSTKLTVEYRNWLCSFD